MIPKNVDGSEIPRSPVDMVLIYVIHTIHVWYIYLNLVDVYDKCRFENSLFLC